MQDDESLHSQVPQPPGFNHSERGFIGGFLTTARAVLLRPKLFFPHMPVAGGYLGPYVFFLICTSFSFLVSLSLDVATGEEMPLTVFLGMTLALLMPFLSAALLNLFCTRLLQTSGSYEATFRVVCYANAVNLLAWIPVFFILALVQLYQIYLCALGLSVVHRTSIGRALLAIVGTVVTVSFGIGLVARLFLSP
ncbi:MAG: YIP1 family protein [Syntrophobacteria bacterium]